MLIESRLILTKSFPRGISKILFGNYQISPVSYFSSTEIEAMLSFSHNSTNSDGKGHPEEEVDIICKLLSVFLNARIRKLGTAADDNNIPVFDGRERLQYPQFFGYLEHDALDDLISRALTLDEDMARQFIRACRCYSYALEQIPSDPAFAFFFFVTAANCMSSCDESISYAESVAADNHADKFSIFVNAFIPDAIKAAEGLSDALITELLKNSFCHHRTSFIDGGKEIASASREADKNGSVYAQVTIDGREVNIPGLAWLSNVVRSALVGYLKALVPPSDDAINEKLFANIGLEKGKLKK